MADFIPPKNEVPEPKLTSQALASVTASSAVGVAEPPAAPAGAYPVGDSAPRPQSPYATQKPGTPAVKRQIVCFSFYKVMPAWRRLPAEEKEAHRQAFVEVLNRWNKPGEFLSLTYSTIGTRGDVDMCIWSIGYGVDELNQMRSELLRTPLGGYLDSPHNFLAMTKRSSIRSTASTSPKAKAAEPSVPVARSTSSSIPSGRPAPGISSARRSASASWTSTSASACSTPRQAQHHLLLRHRRQGVRGRLRDQLPRGLPRPCPAAPRDRDQRLHPQGLPHLQLRPRPANGDAQPPRLALSCISRNMSS